MQICTHLQKNRRFEGTIHKFGIESSIYTSRNTMGEFLTCELLPTLHPKTPANMDKLIKNRRFYDEIHIWGFEIAIHM